MFQWTAGATGGAHVFLSPCFRFLWINIQPWNCWIIRQFYLSFFEELPYCFQSGCTNLHSHQHCTRVPFSLHPRKHWWFLVFLITILTSVRWCLTVVLIFISMMISDVEHFCTYLLAVCMSFLKKKKSIQNFCPFFLSMGSFAFCYWSEFFIKFGYKPLIRYDLPIFSPIQ